MAFQLPRRLAATAVLAALALPVLAQQAPASPSANPAAASTAAPEGRHARHGSERGDHHQRHEAHRAKRLAALKDQLKLTSAQEPAWNTFTAAMQPGERPARLDRKDLDKLTTPERIDRMRALRAQHAAEADRRGEATKAFYAALTPAQQKTFDAHPPRHHRGAHGDGEGRHGRGGEQRHHHGDGGTKPAPAAAPAR
ncbi:Spy/CpxP family protein refolding chaperone [Acidovorax sp. sic0104]|uniref:Spy/CpxP family protein refolding chaperone n=1 Tax=Acidovorax sp. sic0104 TaxID=2854784 RepID=UPI001C4711F7|nr:Spy/CpxP family protein refolding chaperone [Acidovorax sp. sic0104]MBV7542601.1 Spy/CpxP family protein refolding chaperone [Acidovorax sp. sic0104]